MLQPPAQTCRSVCLSYTCWKERPVCLKFALRLPLSGSFEEEVLFALLLMYSVRYLGFTLLGLTVLKNAFAFCCCLKSFAHILINSICAKSLISPQSTLRYKCVYLCFRTKLLFNNQKVQFFFISHSFLFKYLVSSTTTVLLCFAVSQKQQPDKPHSLEFYGLWNTD